MQVDSQILELADPLGPFGARGVAEMPFITYAPALTAAVYDATGVWFDTFPLTPSRVLAGLGPRRSSAAVTPSLASARTVGLGDEQHRDDVVTGRAWADFAMP